jgi:thiamine-monophosphate kinase
MPLPERELIERIRRLARSGRRGGPLLAGIGDDCSILRVAAGHEALLTTDFTLEEIHFRRQWHAAPAVGHRCLARGLSDIAAMGGEPVAAFLSLALPAQTRQPWVDGFLRGFLGLARKFGVALAGGDTAESAGGVAADVVVVGEVPAGEAIRRSGARPGDSIYVTGELGAAAAALYQLRESGRILPAAAARAYFFPIPRLKAGRLLRRQRLASAMIDLSDGFSTDLAHICEESGVGAVVSESSIPRAHSSPAATSTLHFALHGGEDYELLFTVPQGRRVPRTLGGVRLTRVGEIIREKKVWLMDSHGQRKALLPRGWEHFTSGQ